MADKLYVTILLQGLGWPSARPSEEIYHQLVEAIANMVRNDRRFCSQKGEDRRSVSIQVRGYEPTVNGILINDESPEQINFPETRFMLRDCRKWGAFWAEERVLYDGQEFEVIGLPPSLVGEGLVPISRRGVGGSYTLVQESQLVRNPPQ
ncbi:hypothetical protein IID27_02025 [Patescibacteria group bacterium]|nr:hypothetical protein [Patescibacteria group bacterium]